MQWSFTWEEQFLLFLQEQVRRPWLDVIMQAITSLGDAGILAILTCLTLLAVPAYRRVGKTAALSLLLDFFLVNVFLKNLIGRVRPYVLIEKLILITHMPSDASFPSGHTGASFAVASVLFLVTCMPKKGREGQVEGECGGLYGCLPKPVGMIALAIAFLIGFSRLYLGVHYPTDVLAGAVIGLCTGWMAVHLSERSRKQTKIQAE